MNSTDSFNESLNMIYMEAGISSKQRKEMKDSDFGVPEQRKYPMPDQKHVLMAIRFFKDVDPKYEKELAANINKKIKQYDMDVKVGDANPFYKYYNKK